MKYLIIITLFGFSCGLFCENQLEITNSIKQEDLLLQEVLNDTLIINNIQNKEFQIQNIFVSCGCTIISETNFEVKPISVKKIPFTVDLTHTINGKSITLTIVTSNNDTIVSHYNYKVLQLLNVEPKLISVEMVKLVMILVINLGK